MKENVARGWRKGYAGLYALQGEGVLGLVAQHGEVWISAVYVGNKEVDRGEWDGRAVALRNAKSGMERACWLRQFDRVRPRMPPKIENEFECDDEDDEEDDG